MLIINSDFSSAGIKGQHPPSASYVNREDFWQWQWLTTGGNQPLLCSQQVALGINNDGVAMVEEMSAHGPAIVELENNGGLDQAQLLAYC